MGSSADNEVKETADYRTALQIASDRFDKYKKVYVPAEDYAIGEALSYGNANRREQVSGASNAAVQNEFSQAVQRDLATRGARGINPNSGNFNEAISEGAVSEAMAATDNINRTQTALQDEAVKAKKNIVALGNNQATQSMAGINNMAVASGEQAGQKALNDYRKDAANKQGVGAALGMGARAAIEKTGS